MWSKIIGPVTLSFYFRRWTYTHFDPSRPCGTPRKDGRNRFAWLALGPFDIRVNYKGKGTDV